MIFVTVGSAMPFDRLIRSVDNFYQGSDCDVLIQIGESELTPKNARYVNFLSPDEAEQMIRDAELVISHAGMGSIITALSYQTPIVVVPRKAALGEHRNDHQLATCEWVMNDLTGVTVAKDEVELVGVLKNLNTNPGKIEISNYAEARLIDFIASEISGA